MEVTITLDSTNPRHIEILTELITGNPLPPAQPPQPAPVQQPPTPQPVPAAAAPPADRRDALNDLFAKAFAANPTEAQRIADDARTKYGAETNNWTDTAVAEIESRIQALCTF